jgi:CxxC motif-containing protein (DUF1111 family)
MKNETNWLTTKKRSWMYGAAILLVGVGSTVVMAAPKAADNTVKLGDPVPGLTPEQIKLFNDGREKFKKNFTPGEGLGPKFNAPSCYECHGRPGPAGGEGRNLTSTSVTHIGKRMGPNAAKPLKDVICELRENDVDRLEKLGGEALQVKSVTAEFKKQFPAGAEVKPSVVPKEAELVGTRHTGPVYGVGLMEAIPDETILKLEADQKKKCPKMAGRVALQFDPLVKKKRPGRFGYKNIYATVLAFNAEAMRGEMGMSSSLAESKVPLTKAEPPAPTQVAGCLPKGFNDNGKLMLPLTFFEFVLAPPPTGPVTAETKRGEKVFEKLQCGVCHTPVLQTAARVTVPDPASPLPKLNMMEVKALENKPVRLYSDLLLHIMGPELADGIPHLGAKGGEWRTAPLFWLSVKKFYLHDGRAKTLDEAILAHGGQGAEVTQNYKKLKDAEKKDLMSFLKSL